MKQQQGAALVIVMALLAGALMLGMSSMQSALIDERLAGNYRASVQSQMGGETFLSSVISDENRDLLTNILDEAMQNDRDGIVQLNNQELLGLLEERSVAIQVTRNEGQITIEAWGTQGGAKSPSVLVFNTGGATSNFRSPFLACQRMWLTGSSLAASCRSDSGVCSLQQPSFISAESQAYNLLYSLGREQGDSILLEGNVQAFGNVRSQRDIQLTGSSSIKGNAYAQDAIFRDGGAVITGNQSVIGGAPQQCDMFLNAIGLVQQSNALKQGYGNSIGTITIGAFPRRQWALTPSGLFYYDERQATRNCGLLGLGCLISDLINFVFILLGFDACGLQVVNCQRDQIGWVKHANVTNNTIVVNNLSLEQEPTLIVSGIQSNSQSNPARLRIVVEGALTVSGGGAGILVENNSSAEIFVKGQTQLNSNLKMGSGGASRNGQAPLTINSSYAGSGDAVALNGNSHLVGNIYAPEGVVSVYSSRVTGSIWAQQINAISDSQLIFNEANVVADTQSVAGEPSGGGGGGFNWQWR